ncbi:protein kinase [Cedratvirus kamchatka]|uniref:Protein kinase n=1 Tax=Cedratvirus kamchatka TaxID=2716914 RepID=A0A6G8MWZ1_9VIRU|nr:protein kinase [Cedratvirus kamchatka]WIL03949.1 protein kinase [Cedratvirus lena]
MLSLISTLGEGGYGKVYKVKHEGEEKALKCFDYTHGLDCPWELEILSKKIPGLLYDLGRVDWNGNLGVLLPLAQCDLKTYIKSKPDLDPIVSSLCLSLSNMHKHGYYHLDLKPENVLVFEGGEIILADFSISRPAGMKVCKQKFTTHNFRAPELFFPSKDLCLSDKMDSWSLGILLLEILTGFTLSGSEDTIFKKLHDLFSLDKKEKTLSQVPEKYYSLVWGLLELDPKKRLSLSENPLEKANKFKVRFLTSDKLVPYYEKCVQVVQRSGGTWLTCINALTMLQEYYQSKGKVSVSLLLCCVKLAYQLQEDVLFDYKYFSPFMIREEKLASIELSLVLTLPSLVPPVLKTPYPHLTLQELYQKI